jgi:hypothetical protein
MNTHPKADKQPRGREKKEGAKPEKPDYKPPISRLPSPDRKKASTLWKPGVSANPAGKPRGARRRLSEDFLNDFHRMWKRKGIKALERVADSDPSTFVRVGALLMSKDVRITAEVGESFTKLWAAISAGKVLTIEAEPIPDASQDGQKLESTIEIVGQSGSNHLLHQKVAEVVADPEPDNDLFPEEQLKPDDPLAER